MAGRPTKYNAEVHKMICDALRAAMLWATSAEIRKNLDE